MRFFSHRNAVITVGHTAFVHAGLLPHHVDVINHINHDISNWIRNRSGLGNAHISKHVRSNSSVVWSRAYSREDARDCDCDALDRTLKASGLQRVVMGHTIQSHGINTACNVRGNCVSRWLCIQCSC